MSQLIKKLKATQAQNTFVTPQATAKIISSVVPKPKGFYFYFNRILLIFVSLFGICFFKFYPKSEKPSSITNNSTAHNIQISIEPLNVFPATLKTKEIHRESSIQSFSKLTKDFYQQDACLYIKNLSNVIPIIATFISKNLNNYLGNCTCAIQYLQHSQKTNIVHKPLPNKSNKKTITLKDALQVINNNQQNVTQEDYDEQDDFQILAPQLTEKQQQHIDNIYNLLNRMQIESIREEGTQSRLKANGNIYHLNTLVSTKPRLMWIGIQQNELIFNDEYNQEYRKKISKN